MVILRTIGIWLLLVAMIALTVDGTQSLASTEGWVMTPLGEHWFNLHAPSLNTSQAAVERYVHPYLWDPILVTILMTPTWIFFGVLGLLFYWLGRRRRRLEVFSN